MLTDLMQTDGNAALSSTTSNEVTKPSAHVCACVCVILSLRSVRTRTIQSHLVVPWCNGISIEVYQFDLSLLKLVQIRSKEEDIEQREGVRTHTFCRQRQCALCSLCKRLDPWRCVSVCACFGNVASAH